MKQWHEISIEAAKNHPLYGVKNWLAVFAVGILLGGLRELGAVSGEAHKAGMTLQQFLAIDHPAITFTKLALGLNALSVAIIYWLLFTKSRHFRQVSSTILLLGWPLAALVGALNSFDGFGEALGLSLFPWLISCGVWVTYLHRSRRVRVTFEQCVTSADTFPTATQQAANDTSSATPPGISLSASVDRHPPQFHDQSPPATTMKTTPHPTESHVPTSQNPGDLEEALWAAALIEVDGPARRPGLWAKCFAAGNGNESLAKATYLRERVEQLFAERAALEEGQRVESQKQAVAQVARLDGIKSRYLAGDRPTEDEVKMLAGAAREDTTLVHLWERFRGETLLHWTARLGLTEETKLLLELGANPAVSNGKGQRPFTLAPTTEMRFALYQAIPIAERIGLVA